MGRTAWAFQDAGSFWRQRISATPEYPVIEHDNRFRANLARSPVYASTYQACKREREALLNAYEGIDLPECLAGTEISTKEGTCYVIRDRPRFSGFAPDTIPAYDHLIRRLRLVPGIGPVRERMLKEKGCRTIRDLRYIRRFRHYADEVLRILDTGDPKEIRALIRSRFGPADIDMILASTLIPKETFVFLDIETLGVFSRPVFLIGSAVITGEHIQLSQFLARDIDEELPALLAWEQSLPRDAVIISYNGRSFDVPYLADRFAFYGHDRQSPDQQIDLLHITRRVLGMDLPDCRLGTVEEKILGIARESDLPGAMVPESYDIYRRTKNPGPLIPIMNHNRQDVLSLVSLYSHYREMTA